MDSVHNDDVPFGHYIEQKIFDFVRRKADRYPHLYDYLSGSTADLDNQDSSIELEDIGYWTEVVEETVQEPTIRSRFNNYCFQTGADSIQLDGTVYSGAQSSE